MFFTGMAPMMGKPVHPGVPLFVAFYLNNSYNTEKKPTLLSLTKNKV